MAPTIRAVERALHLIETMNSRETWTLHDVAHASGLAKTTVHRLLGTLRECGYVHNPPARPGMYRLTSHTRDLSAGLTAATRYADVAEPIIIQYTRSLQWPLSLAVPEAPFMRVVACGMPHSPDHSAKPTSIGARHWMFSSAVGKAFLSRCSTEKIEAIRRKGAAFCDSSDVELVLPSICMLHEEMRALRDRGYAIRIATRADLNSTVAVPVYRNDRVYASLACTTFPDDVIDGLTSAAELIAAQCEK